MADLAISALVASDPAAAFNGSEKWHLIQGSPAASKGGSSEQMKTFVEILDINLESATYTLAVGDAGGVVEMDVAGSNNCQIPTNASAAFPVGSQITVVQVGAGQTTITAAGGVTLRNAAPTNKLRAQWSVASIYKRGTDEWVLTGDLAAS